MAICNKPGHGDNESFMSELEQRCIQAETALAEEQHLLQTLIDAMPDRIFVKDTNSRFTRNNRVHRKVLGALCQTEITGKTDYDFKPPESAARSHADDQLVMNSGSPLIDFEEPTRLPSGETGTLLVSKFPLHSTSGKLIGLLGLSRDITEKKQAEQKLRESEARIRAITESTQDAVLMMDPKGCISFWNRAAELLFGYSKSETIGQNLHQLLAPKRFHAAHAIAFDAFRQTGKGNAINTTLELSAIHKAGHELSIELSLSSIQLSDGWHAVGIIRDITERKRLEQELRLHANKLEEIVELRTQDLFLPTRSCPHSIRHWRKKSSFASKKKAIFCCVKNNTGPLPAC